MDKPANNDVALKIRLSLKTRRISLIAVMTALCVSSNYLLIGVANIKFMDLVVFVSGYSFGPFVGGAVGILTWLVYGTINPYGFSLPILVATCLGESLYGLVGGYIGNLKIGSEEKGSKISFKNFKFAMVGFFLTFAYDLFTNIISGVVVGIPVHIALISGAPFSLIHELSNVAFFFFGVSPMVNMISRLPEEVKVS